MGRSVRARQVGAGRRSIAPSRSKETKGKTGGWVLGWVQLQRVPVISFSSNLLLAEVDQTEHGRGAIGRSFCNVEQYPFLARVFGSPTRL